MANTFIATNTGIPAPLATNVVNDPAPGSTVMLLAGVAAASAPTCILLTGGGTLTTLNGSLQSISGDGVELGRFAIPSTGGNRLTVGQQGSITSSLRGIFGWGGHDIITVSGNILAGFNGVELGSPNAGFLTGVNTFTLTASGTIAAGNIGIKLVGGHDSIAVMGNVSAGLHGITLGIEGDSSTGTNNLTIAQGANVSASNFGVHSVFGDDTIQIDGRVTTTGYAAVQLGTDTLGTNSGAGTHLMIGATGSISGDTAIVIESPGSQVRNNGLLQGTELDAMRIRESGSIVRNYGTIEGAENGIIGQFGYAGAAGLSVVNAGAIVGSATLSSASGIVAAGNLDVFNTGTVSGYTAIRSEILDVTNSGLIRGTKTGIQGATLSGSLQVDNRGTIEAEDAAITGLNLTISNSGLIQGGETAIAGNESLSIQNSGVITADSAILFGSTASFAPVSIINSGTMSALLQVISFALATSQAASIVNTSSGKLLAAVQSADAINIAGGTIEIVNNGEIVGRVVTGDGDDSYDGSLGRINGAINVGGGADLVIGGASRENITGGAGNDELSGGGGNDAFVASDNDGDDIYDGGDGIDRISFAGVSSGVAIDIAGQTANSTSGAGIGSDFILSVEQVIGSASIDSLFGDASSNLFYGGLGSDTLAGLEGDDRLFGDSGNDNIIGGTGKDYLTGGLSRDTFRYQAISDSTFAASGTDRILDFVSVADAAATAGTPDVINLSAIDADGNSANGNQAFVYIGYNNGAAPAFTGIAGQLRTYTNATSTTFVEADVNGDLLVDFRILISGAHTMAAGDFVL